MLGICGGDASFRDILVSVDDVTWFGLGLAWILGKWAVQDCLTILNGLSRTRTRTAYKYTTVFLYTYKFSAQRSRPR